MIGSQLFCFAMIVNGVLVATGCYFVLLPFINDRTELLGTNEAKLEAIYAMSLPGWGALISTAVALVILWGTRAIYRQH